ncbi:MAG TPA: class I SAM-dependent methyltransferase [Alcanivoracaceae bacterium]|nr:class I SAM-dependent methyltransferase [Alcanivoracaceae bacterium]
MNYYNTNAETFAQATLGVDMAPLYSPFLRLLPAQAHLLDAGCGAGRDTKAFAQLGHKVEAFDACEALVAIARQHSNVHVKHSTFTTFTSANKFDGIWACASLLHVPARKLPATFAYLANFLKEQGVFYVSFKYGEGEEERDGRHFTHCNEKVLSQYIGSSPLHVEKTWRTTDQRPGREEEQWFNALLIKNNA